MELVLCGLALCFNIVVIIKKFRELRYMDGFLDLCCLGIITVVFSGSYSALVAGTSGSAFLSIYLWFRPLEKRVKKTITKQSKYAMKKA